MSTEHTLDQFVTRAANCHNELADALRVILATKQELPIDVEVRVKGYIALGNATYINYAEFSALANNCHNELVEALKACEWMFHLGLAKSESKVDKQSCSNVLDLVRTAIAKATNI